MTKKALPSAENIKMTDEYLCGYTTSRRLIEIDGYEKKYFSCDDEEFCASDVSLDISLAKAKMFEVRHFVLSLDNSDEKLLLYYHYIKGQSMEHCAELLGVARSTVYRIKKRALALASKRLFEERS
jgi:DNA-directed RNA polymerase specialized sigma subunit